MTHFRRAIKKTLVQCRFHFRQEPWRMTTILEQIETFLEESQDDQGLLAHLTQFLAEQPDLERQVVTPLSNVLTVYQHSVLEQPLETEYLLSIEAMNQRWPTELASQRSVVMTIGFNEETRRHVISLLNTQNALQAYYIDDPDNLYVSTYLPGNQCQASQPPIQLKRMLSSVLPQQAREQLLEWMMTPTDMQVLSIVEPEEHCPEGEVILQQHDGTLLTLSMQHQPLFLGESNSYQQSQLIHVSYPEAIEGETSFAIPATLWFQPWFAHIAQTFWFEKSEEINETTKETPVTLMVALHGLFDHKGAYHEVAKTILAKSPATQATFVLAVDWPTYGDSLDRDQPMPDFTVMRDYLMAVLHYCLARFPRAQITLLGESLGASVCMIARKALADLQEHHHCLKGIIAVSPAIHDPTTNLYLQKRALGLSAAPDVFHRIWFHDPKVNHQQALSRMRATIPYLSEAYQHMQQWPDTIPMMVFLTSQDSVVSRQPALSLYQTNVSDHIIFMAFPSRHLLLRSCDESGKYIRAPLIHQDIAFLLHQVTWPSLLPYSGTQSDATMAWYGALDHCSFTLFCQPRGYLTDWPSVMPDEQLPSPAPQAPRSKPLWLGIIETNQRGLEFEEELIPGHGDCGFVALGITRPQFVTSLLAHKDELELRQRFVLEIKEALITQVLNQNTTPENLWQCYQGFLVAEQSLEALMIECKSTLPEDYPAELDLDGRVAWLAQQLPDASVLEGHYAHHQEANHQLTLLCEQITTFEWYLNLYAIPQFLWLSYAGVRAYAQYQRMNLTIWAPHPSHASQLQQQESIMTDPEGPQLHLIHTQRFTHFNRLRLLQERDFQEEMQHIQTWNNTDTAFDFSLSLYELIAQRAALTPEAPALLSRNDTITYATLLTRANQIAHFLLQQAVEPNQLVILLMEKGWEQIVASLGVLAAGVAFLPLDPHWPKERLLHLIEKSQSTIILSQQTVMDAYQTGSLFEGKTVLAVDNFEHYNTYPTETPHIERSLETLAYVIYTSGSTGEPKGVMISQQNVLNTLLDINQRFSVNHSTRTLALSAFTFDLGVYDAFGPLIAGGAVVIPEPGLIKEPAHWQTLMTQHHVTLWNSVPMFMQMFVEHLSAAQSEALWKTNLQHVLLSGDWLPLTLPDAIRSHFLQANVISLGGATEGSIWSILYPVDTIQPGWKSIPYGLPMANQHMYVLDENLEPCPFGVKGDIYIGGLGVAMGYWQDEDRTKQSFVIHPVTGERLYKTGDGGIWNAQGYIEFIGREDTQVQVNGFRVELGEIEATLNRHPGVEHSVVNFIASENLIAYVVPKTKEDQPEQQQHISDWQTVYEGVYQSQHSRDVTFNLAGWKSSYTGLPIPHQEMKEWVDYTVHRILNYKPRRLLEIGCGTGLLVSRLAPHCEQYVATDISSTAITLIEQLKKTHSELAHVVTYHRSAEDFSDWEGEQFDVIVLNSVIQCFPCVSTLLQVIEGAKHHLTNNGILFIGDVRHLGLLHAYHLSVASAQSPETIDRNALKQRIQHRLSQEEELLVDPTFFYALKHHFPELQHVTCQLKAGHAHNELTRFRYDVVLRFSNDPILCLTPAWQDWNTFGTLPQLTDHMTQWALSQEEPALFAIKGIPNARLTREHTITQWLAQADFHTTVSVSQLPFTFDATLDPHACYLLGERLGLKVEIRWHYDQPLAFFDVIFIGGLSPTQPPPVIDCLDGCCQVLDWRAYVNNPLLKKWQRELTPGLKEHIQQQLPEYMRPDHFYFLERLPLSPNGKVDRHALARLPQQVSAQTINAPTTPLEQQCHQLWVEVLNIQDIDVHHSFASLGGKSMQAVQLILKLNKKFKTNHPVSLVFTQNTIALQAQFFHTQQQAAEYQPLLRFNEQGQLTPIFFVHSGRGGAEAYIELASNFSKNQPVYVIESYNVTQGPPYLETIEATATQYLQYVRSIQPEGPYRLGGWSQGGIVALEMAQQLLSVGETVSTLYFLDTFLYNRFERQQFKDPKAIQNFLNNDPHYQALPLPFRGHVQMAEKLQTLAMLNYEVAPYSGSVVLLKATQAWTFLDNPAFKWSWLSRQFMHHAFSKKHNGWSQHLAHLTIYPIEGDHQSIMRGEAARAMTTHIQEHVQSQRSQFSTSPELFRRVMPADSVKKQQQSTSIEQKI